MLSASRNYTPILLPVGIFNLPTVTSGNPAVTSLVLSANNVAQVQ